MGAAESVAKPAVEETNERRTMALGQYVKVEQDLDVNRLIVIAEEAGKAIMKVYEGDNWDVDHKADDSPLTRADREANQIICDALMEWTPHIPIISEENKLVPYSIRKNYKYCWIVDPLDGTKEFIKRVPHFTVNVALVCGNAPVMGVVYTPAANTSHFAIKGRGAYVRTPTGDDQAVSCKAYDPAESGITVVGSASHMSPLTEEFLAQYNSPNLTQIGSSLKFLLVAEGLASCYPRLAPTCEWDTAAAHIIVEEAGGSVMQAGKCDNTGAALESWQDVLPQEKVVEYNKEDVLNPFFVVYGRRGGAASAEAPAAAAADAAAAAPAEAEAEPPSEVAKPQNGV
eukprot:jgi/Ulvmu1/11689/UM008_0099.1